MRPSDDTAPDLIDTMIRDKVHTSLASRNELVALLALLDDPSPVVKEHVRARLRQAWPSDYVALERLISETAPDRALALGELLRGFYVEDLLAQWRTLLREEDVDLEAGAFLIARYASPNLEEACYRRRLDAFADRIRRRVANASGSGRAMTLASFFCEELGFTGNQKHYYDYRNSYIDWVIDHRVGIPISLSVVFLLIAERLDLPMYGANIPLHFLVTYADAHSELFIDLFHGGTPLNRTHVRRFLREARVQITEEHFAETSARTILLRMVRNLLFIARRHDDAARAADFARFLDAAPEPER